METLAGKHCGRTANKRACLIAKLPLVTCIAAPSMSCPEPQSLQRQHHLAIHLSAMLLSLKSTA